MSQSNTSFIFLITLLLEQVGLMCWRQETPKLSFHLSRRLPGFLSLFPRCLSVFSKTPQAPCGETVSQEENMSCYKTSQRLDPEGSWLHVLCTLVVKARQDQSSFQKRRNRPSLYPEKEKEKRTHVCHKSLCLNYCFLILYCYFY